MGQQLQKQQATSMQLNRTGGCSWLWCTFSSLLHSPLGPYDLSYAPIAWSSLCTDIVLFINDKPMWNTPCICFMHTMRVCITSWIEVSNTNNNAYLSSNNQFVTLNFKTKFFYT